MTLKKFLGLLIIFICSCSDKQSKQLPETYLGINIINDPIKGSLYADSTGTQYAYRYVKASIINDSLVPINIKITFSKDYYSVTTYKEWKFRVFLLPDTILLPDTMIASMQYDIIKDTHHATTKLEKFLDTDLQNPITLEKTINSKDTCIVNIGLLFSLNYVQPEVALFSKGQRFQFITIEDSVIVRTISATDQRTLFLGVNFFKGYSFIPCGQISFPN